MYRFTLHSKNGDVGAEYLDIFSSKIRVTKSKKFKRVIQNNPDLSFLNGISYDDILIASYDTLVEIFYQYISLSESTQNVLNSKLKECFPYKSQRSKIMDFIEGHAKLLKATTCPYCDCNEINVYHRKGSRRDYHIDHYLDKGRCPIVALSLYNFVPVCPACNTVKSTQTFGIKPLITKSLSPMNPNYDFDGNAYFRLIQNNEEILQIQSEDWCKKIKIDLQYHDKRYEKEIKVTKILRRFYNNKKSLTRQKLTEYIYFVCAEFESTYGAVDPRFALWAQRYLETSTEKERRKGLRKPFDKFKRDIKRR